MKTLEQLQNGIATRIKWVHGESDSATRLHALGVLPGRRIERRNTALFGDPVAYSVDGQKISMRRSEASLVEIH